jgi:hypothetical protein
MSSPPPRMKVRLDARTDARLRVLATTRRATLSETASALLADAVESAAVDQEIATWPGWEATGGAPGWSSEDQESES